jgi:nucleoside-diphosphate-sugar epimerase
MGKKTYAKEIRSKKTFLVTGASGFLGYNLCKFLVGKKQRVIGVDISDFNYDDLKDKVTFYKADIREKLMMEKIMKEVDIVVHAAAALPLWSKKEIFSVNVYGTRVLLELAYKYNVERFIFISTTAVYGIPKTHPVTEESPIFPIGPYAESKIKAEELCIEYRKKGMCVPIIRPKTFVGEARLGVFSIFFDWVRTGHNFPIIGNGKNKYQLLDVGDLTEAIWLCCVKDKNIVNDTFNVGAKEFKTMKEDFQAVLDYAGYGKRIIPTPAWLVIPTIKILSSLKLLPLYPWIYETAHIEHYVDISKIEKKLGWKPKKSTSQALVDSYKWYEKHWKEYENSSGITHRTKWKEGIMKLLRLFI